MYSQTLHACRFTCENPENFLTRIDLLGDERGQYVLRYIPFRIQHLFQISKMSFIVSIMLLTFLLLNKRISS